VNNKNNSTLVVESIQFEAIKRAHIKALELFNHVSSIDSGIGQKIYFFIIAPSISEGLSKDCILESAAQQAFMNWCEDENKRMQKLVLRLAKVDY